MARLADELSAYSTTIRSVVTLIDLAYDKLKELPDPGYESRMTVELQKHGLGGDDAYRSVRTLFDAFADMHRLRGQLAVEADTAASVLDHLRDRLSTATAGRRQ